LTPDDSSLECTGQPLCFLICSSIASSRYHITSRNDFDTSFLVSQHSIVRPCGCDRIAYTSTSGTDQQRQEPQATADRGKARNSTYLARRQVQLAELATRYEHWRTSGKHTNKDSSLFHKYTTRARNLESVQQVTPSSCLHHGQEDTANKTGGQGCDLQSH